MPRLSADADIAGDLDGARSTSGNLVVFIGPNTYIISVSLGAPLSKQPQADRPQIQRS